MFMYEYISEVIVIPCNCSGKMSQGIGAEASRKWPDWFSAYYASCMADQLKIGRLHVYQLTQNNRYIVSLPTKDFYGDNTNIDELTRSVEKLRQFLLTKPGLSAVMPMFTNVFRPGSVEAIRVSQDEVYAMLADRLGDLPNVIHICMRPGAFEHIPRYLGVVGTRELRDYQLVRKHVLSALEQWKLTPADFDGIISGGAVGTDSIAIMDAVYPFELKDTPQSRSKYLGCGCRFDEDTTYTTLTEENFPSMVGRTVHHIQDLASDLDISPILVLPAFGVYGLSAGFVRNRTIADVLTHGVAFEGSVSKGTKHTISCIHRLNEGYAEDRRIPPKGKENQYVPEDKKLIVVPVQTK